MGKYNILSVKLMSFDPASIGIKSNQDYSICSWKDVLNLNTLLLRKNLVLGEVPIF